MPYVSKELVEEARQMDLLTYLQLYEPDNLVKLSNENYCTREHDSLKISNGMWYWFTQNVGGRSALDYLVKVKEMDFVSAVELITERAAERPPVYVPVPVKAERKQFKLPKTSSSSARVIKYLESRGIERDVIEYCLKRKMIYESYPRHNAVFVGFNACGKACYAMQRGCGTDFVGDVSGSDKNYSFCLQSANKSGTLYLFESPIDLLSFASLLKMGGYNWLSVNMLSLSGVYKPSETSVEEANLPIALEQYLKDNPTINNVITRFDNDEIGIAAAGAVCDALFKRGITASERTVPKGKDYNDYLCILKGLPITHRKQHDKSAKKGEIKPELDSTPDRKSKSNRCESR